NAGQNMYGVVIKSLPNSVSNPPEILNLNPTNNTLFYNASGGISFSVTTVTPNTIATTNILLFLNGANVSSNLVITGSSDNRSVSYSALNPGAFYRARIVAIDQAG